GDSLHFLFELCDHHVLFLKLAALFLDFAMLFKELVEQRRVHRLITHSVRLSLGVASHKGRIDLLDLLRNQPKLRRTIRINLPFVPETNRLKCDDNLARLVHRLDVVLETPGRGLSAKLTAATYVDRRTHNGYATDPRNEGGCMRRHRVTLNRRVAGRDCGS